jgi:hypothetical protein
MEDLIKKNKITANTWPKNRYMFSAVRGF